MSWQSDLKYVSEALKRLEIINRRRDDEIAEQKVALEEVQAYDDYIFGIQNMHIECCDSINWAEIKSCASPSMPVNKHIFEDEAKQKLQNFQPNFFQKAFDLEGKLIIEHEKAIIDAVEKDKADYGVDVAKYYSDLSEWHQNQGFADKMLKKNFRALAEVVKTRSDLPSGSAIASSIKFSIIEKNILVAHVNVNSEDVVPKYSKSVTDSGRLSIKDLTKTAYYRISQDYVCSAVLRVARELFAVSTFDHIIINVVDNVVNTATGMVEEVTILSISIKREEVDGINFKRIDPSDAMSNFKHNMNFSKTSGFSSVEQLDSSHT